MFLQCHVGEQGGAIRFDGKGKVRVENTTYQDCSVRFSADPICLTLTMFDALHSFRQRRDGALSSEVDALATTLATSSKEIDALIGQLPGLERTSE